MINLRLYRTPERKAYHQQPHYKEFQRKYGKGYRQKNPEYFARAASEYRLKQKLRLFEILGGPRCANPVCLVPGGCKELLALEIDHKNDDGNIDRKRFSQTGVAVNYYLKHPDEAKTKLQVLCSNCNQIKRMKVSSHYVMNTINVYSLQ